MKIGNTYTAVNYDDIKKIDDYDLCSKYLCVQELPCVINSPLRDDKNPSLSIFVMNDGSIGYYDFATRQKGTIRNLLCQMFHCDNDVKKLHEIIYNDFVKNKQYYKHIQRQSISRLSGSTIEVKIRQWMQHDKDYWMSYGIPLEWLKFAEVYPISHKFITKNGVTYTFGAEKYAYAYVERKDGNIQIKIYQPFNKDGFKWCSNIDKSAWSLWTKVPQRGRRLIITSSLKDSLNLWANTKIPSLSMQSEGLMPKPQVIEELHQRFDNIYLFFDNDYNKDGNPGHTDALKWIEEYPYLKMIEIPAEYEAKDPSDLYKKYGKEEYLNILRKLFIKYENS